MQPPWSFVLRWLGTDIQQSGSKRTTGWQAYIYKLVNKVFFKASFSRWIIKFYDLKAITSESGLNLTAQVATGGLKNI